MGRGESATYASSYPNYNTHNEILFSNPFLVDRCFD